MLLQRISARIYNIFYTLSWNNCAAVEILAEVVQGNALDEKEIEKQKTILLKELEAS